MARFRAPRLIIVPSRPSPGGPCAREPTLVVSGDHDLPLFLQMGDTLVRRIPGAKRVIISDGGHGAHFAQPARFNAAVLGFLADAGRR